MHVMCGLTWKCRSIWLDWFIEKKSLYSTLAFHYVNKGKAQIKVRSCIQSNSYFTWECCFLMKDFQQKLPTWQILTWLTNKFCVLYVLHIHFLTKSAQRLVNHQLKAFKFFNIDLSRVFFSLGKKCAALWRFLGYVALDVRQECGRIKS